MGSLSQLQKNVIVVVGWVAAIIGKSNLYLPNGLKQ
jgi:hypothetical protein